MFRMASRQDSNAPSAFAERVRKVSAILLASVSLFALLATTTHGVAQAEPTPRDPATANGTGGRSASVTPGVSLTNEVVTVSWSGFRPTTQQGVYTVLVVQCRANPTSMTDCYSAEPFPDLANGNRVLDSTASDGTGSAQFEVRPASVLPQLACSATNPCSLLVYENDALPILPGTLPAAHVVIPLTFAPSQADCPNITDFDVRVDGSATSAALFYTWAAQVCAGSDPVVVDYTETSSTTGRENFLNGLVDIGVSALPASEEELGHHPGHRDFSYAPVAASAVVVAYNLTDPFTGQRIDNLVVSPRLVARLVTNSSVETFIRDRELLNLNPTVRFPANGVNRILVRAERSASTSILTNWIATDAEAQKLLSNNDTWRVALNPAYVGYTYPKDSFELVDTDPAYLPRQGQKNLALRLFYGVSPTGSQAEPTTARGVIGVVDLPTARRFGLQVAGLLASDGSVVRPTDESILKGILDADRSASGVLIADPTPEDRTAYPLIKVDYAMVPKSFDSEAKVADVRRVLSYAVGAGQDILPAGYVALPETLRAEARAVIDVVGLPTTTVAPTTPAPVTTVRVSRPRMTVAPTTIPETTTTSTTSSTTTTTTTTTTLAPITIPEPEIGSGIGSARSGTSTLLALGGLSGAALLGTAPWQRALKRRPRRPKGGTA